MADFPDTTEIDAPDYPLGEHSIMGTVKSDFEAGYVQTRAKFTRARKRFILKWSMLSASQFATLQTFFEETAVGAANNFTWTHPISDVEYDVRFKEDELKFNLTTPGETGFYQGSFTLEQV